MAQNYDSIVAAEPGLQYYWKLAEAAGTTNLAESVAGVNNGTAQGTVTLGQAGIPGSTDTAAGLDGATGYVSTATQIAAIAAPLTMECWFKTTHASGGLMAMTTPATGNAPTGFVPALLVGSDSKVYFELWNGAAAQVLSSGGTYTDGNWHHAVGVVAANNNMSLWVDGVLVASNANTGALGSPNSYWRLGYAYGGGGGWGIATSANAYFNGTLAQVAVYGAALSASQIGNHSLVGHNYAVKGNSPNANASAKSLNTSGISKKSLSTIVPGTTGATSGQLWPL